MRKTKKLTAAFFAMALIISNMFSAYAEPTQAPDTTHTTKSGVYMENPNLDEPDTSHAKAALLIDMKSGRVIYGKNSDERLYPASTTKMMTAILALESDKMNDTVTATYDALESITLEDSHMGILIGETLTMTDLLNGTLVYSANDASNVIAVHVGGSIPEFVDLMNAKAQELGMKNTHFVNACGVHHEDHYTTADDLAILARYCMENAAFREIVAKPFYHIDPTNKYGLNRDLPSTNLFLSTARSAHHLYKPCTGIKTGTTDAAGHCLVSSAKYKDMELLSVVLKCDDLDVKENAFSYKISRALFDFGFNNYESGMLASPGTVVADSKVYEAKKDKRVSLTVASEITALIPIGDDISKDVKTDIVLKEKIAAPILKGDVLGEVVYKYHDKEIARADLIASNDVELNMLLHIFHLIINFLINPLFFIPAILIILAVLTARAKKLRMERKKKLHQIRQRRAEEGSPEIYAQKRKIRNSELNHSRSKSSTSRYRDKD